MIDTSEVKDYEVFENVSATRPGLVDRPRSQNRLVIFAVATLTAIHAGMLAYSATRHSPTRLEPAFLMAGLSHYRLGNFVLYSVNPPLVRMVAALPVLAAGYKADWSRFEDAPGARPEFAMGADFMRANGERSIWLFTIARWACIPFSLAGALFCFFWSRELWGRNDAGLISLILWCFDPNVLAHGELITTDCAAASLGLGASYFFWRWLKNRTWVRAGIAGLLFALAQLAKFSWIFLYALWPALWLIWAWSERREAGDRIARRRTPFLASTLQLAYILGLGLYLTNLAFGFSGTGTRLGEFRFVSHMLGGGKPGEEGNRFAASALGKVPVPLPSHYVLGFDLQKKDFEDYKHPSYLRGQWIQGGWWYYYLYGLAVKTPHGSQLLLSLAIFAFIYPCMRRCVARSPARRRDLSVLLLPALMLFALVSSQLEFNEHIRYVLPSMGFAFVAVGAAAFWFSGRPQASPPRMAYLPPVVGCRILVALSLLATATSTLGVYPRQLAYFNELAGGPLNGPRHLLGSNVDWGQGLIALDGLLDARPEWGPVALLSQGWPEAIGSRVIPERAQTLTDSLERYSHVAISVNELAGEGQALRPETDSTRRAGRLLAALRHQSPADVTDYSTLVFEVRPLLARLRQEGLAAEPHGPAEGRGSDRAFPDSLPSLADTSDAKLTVSTLAHVLLLRGPFDTRSETPATGAEALRILTDERSAASAFGRSPFVRTRNGLRYKADGVSASEEQGVGEAHRDQCLSTFALIGLPLTHPIALRSETCHIQDLLSESIANFDLDQSEITWTAVAYARYLPPARQWTDRFGRTTGFSALLQRLIDVGYDGQSCGGLHVMEAIAEIVEADRRSGILDRRTRLEGWKFLRDSLERAALSQSEDGSWDLGWFRPDPGGASRAGDPSSLEAKIAVTGHMLQLMSKLRDPPRRATYRAARWTIGTLEGLPRGPGTTHVRVCPLTHALVGVRSLCMSLHSSSELGSLLDTRH